MKKIGFFLIMLMLLLPITARAAEAPYENFQQLWEQWQETGLPDYISGVWSNDGSLEDVTIGIVESRKQQAQQLLAQLPDSSITILYQQYSWNELFSIQQALECYMQQDYGLVALGIDVYENRLEAEFHSDYQEDPRTQALIRQLSEQYGDTVHFQFSDLQLIPVTAPSQSLQSWLPQQAQPTGPWMLLVCGALALTLGCGFLVRRQQYKLLLLAPAQTRQLNTKQAALCFQKRALECPASVDHRLEHTLGIPLS